MGIANQPITINKYLYAGSNPVMMIDPSGNSFTSIGQLTTIGLVGTLATVTAVIFQSSFNGSDSGGISLGNVSLANIYFSYIDQINRFSLSMDSVQIMSGSQSSSEAAERQADYEEYKYGPCDPKNQIPPPGMNACQAALWKLNVVKQCRDKRQAWDDKWQPGTHAQEIDNIGRWVLKLEKIVEKACK